MRNSVQLIELAATAGTAGLFGYGFAHWGDAGFSATVAASIAGGVIGNCADRLICRGSDLVSRALGARAFGELPRNHDVARALRRAQLNAIAAIAAASIRENSQRHCEHDRSAMLQCERDAAFCVELKRWVSRQRRKNERSHWTADLPPAVSILADRIPDLLSEDLDCTAIFPASAAASMAELAAAGMTYLPEPFIDAMSGRDDSLVPAWDIAMRSYFWEEIKTRTAVHRVISLRIMLRRRSDGGDDRRPWRLTRARSAAVKQITALG